MTGTINQEHSVFGFSESPNFKEVLIGGFKSINATSKILFGNSFNSTTGTSIKLQVNSAVGSDTPIDAVIIRESGNVGIGTNSPSQN